MPAILLPGLHADPTARDIVADLTTNALESYCADGDNGLWLPLGTDINAHILTRASATNFPALVDSSTRLRLLLFPLANFSAPPLFEAFTDTPAPTNYLASLGTVSFSGSTVTVSAAHGLRVGQPVHFTTTGTFPSTSPTMTSSVIWYVRTIPTNTTLTITDDLATGSSVTFGSAGSGTMNIYRGPLGFTALAAYPLPFRLDSPTLRRVVAGMNAPVTGDVLTAGLAASAVVEFMSSAARYRSRAMRVTVGQ